MPDGAWTITYDVVATNPDATLGTLYDLTDTLAFGTGITVTSATVTGPAGVTVNPGWNGALRHHGRPRPVPGRRVRARPTGSW